MRLSADEALIFADVRTLPVDPAALAEFFRIKLVTYQECGEIFEKSRTELYQMSRFGFSFIHEERYVCAINENSCGERRRRWTIAHELGHCLLGHISGEVLTEQQEQEADRFAAELLAPLTVLHFCGVSSAEELGKLCGLSAQAAQIRFGELNRLRRSSAERFRRWRVTDRMTAAPKSGFLGSSGDMRLMMQFSGFIGQYIYERSCG